MLAASQCLRGYGSHDGQDAVVRYLLLQGARCDVQNRHGKTAESVMNPLYRPAMNLVGPGVPLDRPPSRVARVF